MLLRLGEADCAAERLLEGERVALLQDGRMQASTALHICDAAFFLAELFDPFVSEREADCAAERS